MFLFLWPDPNEKKYSSEIKDHIDLKPGSNFGFVHCLEVFKKVTKLDHERILPYPFLRGSPKTFVFLSPNQKEKKYSCESKGCIDLKPGSNYEFVHCLKV